MLPCTLAISSFGSRGPSEIDNHRHGGIGDNSRTKDMARIDHIDRSGAGKAGSCLVGHAARTPAGIVSHRQRCGAGSCVARLPFQLRPRLTAISLRAAKDTHFTCLSG